MIFFANFISLEPFIVWSRAPTHFNPKTQVVGGNCTEAQHFENQKLLKISIFDLEWS